jgi:hypothetical protein
MSQNELTSVANADTPENVTVPNTWQGLIVWALARFGVGIVVAGVFGYSTTIVYADLRADRAALMDAYRDNIQAVEKFTHAIEDLTDRIEDQTP